MSHSMTLPPAPRYSKPHKGPFPGPIVNGKREFPWHTGHGKRQPGGAKVVRWEPPAEPTLRIDRQRLSQGYQTAGTVVQWLTEGVRATVEAHVRQRREAAEVAYEKWTKRPLAYVNPTPPPEYQPCTCHVCSQYRYDTDLGRYCQAIVTTAEVAEVEVRRKRADIVRLSVAEAVAVAMGAKRVARPAPKVVHESWCHCTACKPSPLRAAVAVAVAMGAPVAMPPEPGMRFARTLRDHDMPVAYSAERTLTVPKDGIAYDEAGFATGYEKPVVRSVRRRVYIPGEVAATRPPKRRFVPRDPADKRRTYAREDEAGMRAACAIATASQAVRP